MSNESKAALCGPHGKPITECVLCDLEKQKTEGKALAADLTEVLKRHGLESPADQFGTLLGMGVTGLAVVTGMELPQMLAAVEEAFGKVRNMGTVSQTPK